MTNCKTTLLFLLNKLDNLLNLEFLKLWTDQFNNNKDTKVNREKVNMNGKYVLYHVFDSTKIVDTEFYIWAPPKLKM